MRVASVVSASIVLLGLATCPAQAEGRDEFRDFFDALAGEWRCEVRQLDPDGRVTWQDEQRRVILRYLSDRVYAHEAWLRRRSTGEWVRAGVQLIAFDDATGRVRMDGFWSHRAGRNDVVTGRLEPDGVAGEAVSDREPERIRRYELRLGEDGVLVERSWSRTAEGREYLDHELRYRREPDRADSGAAGGT